MGLFWTPETERKEKEIREAVNSINMILRRMDTIDDFGTGRSKEQIFRDLQPCIMEINPYMQRINAIWQLDECRFGNTKVLTPDGRYIPLGLWMTNFTMLMGKLEIEMHKHYGTF